MGSESETGMIGRIIGPTPKTSDGKKAKGKSMAGRDGQMCRRSGMLPRGSPDLSPWAFRAARREFAVGPSRKPMINRTKR